MRILPQAVTYAGRAWAPDRAQYVNLPHGSYPVLDLVSDQYGAGVVVAGRGEEVVIEIADLRNVTFQIVYEQ